MSRCWSMLNNHRGRDSRPAASHGHVPNPTGPDVDTPSGGGEVPESARSRTDRPGRSAGAREALGAIPNTKRPARTRQKKTKKTTGHRNGGERRRTQEAPAEEDQEPPENSQWGGNSSTWDRDQGWHQLEAQEQWMETPTEWEEQEWDKTRKAKGRFLSAVPPT